MVAKYTLRFQVVTEASMKMSVFWVVLDASTIRIALMMETASTSETSVIFYKAGATTQKTAILILAAVRISNLPFFSLLL
jgi:hypothetical protein